MHEVLHLIGLCPDSMTHLDLSDILVVGMQEFPYINLNTIKYYVTKRLSSRRATTN